MWRPPRPRSTQITLMRHRLALCNPFRKATMDQLETTIVSLTTRGEQLAAKRAAAQDALGNATTARQQALLTGDLDDQRALDKLQGIVDTAAPRCRASMMRSPSWGN